MTVETIFVLPGGSNGRHRDPATGDWVDALDDETLVDTPGGRRGWPLEVLQLEPRSAGDIDAEGRDGFRDGWVVYAPMPPRLVDPSDRVEVPPGPGRAGGVYTIEGVPGAWVNTFAPGLFDGLQFTLERGAG